MKLVQVSTRYPPAPGGVERHVGEISHRLATRGHSVTALATDLYREIPWNRLPSDIPREAVVEGVHVRRLRAFSLPGDLHYPFFRGLGRALRSEAPDVVHVHTYGTNHASVTARFSRRTGVPWVLTAHYHPIWSIWGGNLRHRLRRFYDRRLGGPVVASARRVIVQSREEERLLRENGFPLPPVVIIPPGYAPMATAASSATRFAATLGVDGPFALFIGRLASNKGLEVLLSAFAKVRQREPSARLVIVGEDGGMRPALETQVRSLGLEHAVRFTGYLSDEALVAAGLREALVLVLPSEYEAFGLVLLEALAQGTPVIATRVGGIPEFIEDGKAGRLVPPGNVEALTAALEEVWNDEPLRRQRGDYGRSSVVPRYTWDRVVDRLEEVYREVAGR
ncbi:MAG: glycosyltransferase family 4 protein [Thermoplasmata archaeon]